MRAEVCLVSDSAHVVHCYMYYTCSACTMCNILFSLALLWLYSHCLSILKEWEEKIKVVNWMRLDERCYCSWIKWNILLLLRRKDKIPHSLGNSRISGRHRDVVPFQDYQRLNLMPGDIEGALVFLTHTAYQILMCI